MNKIEKADIQINKNDFFTKKRIIVFSVLTTFLIIFSVIFSIFALKININEINNFFKIGIKNNLFYLWLFIMLIFSLFLTCWSSIIICIRVKKEGIKTKWYEWISLSFISAFLRAITPFSTGSEPYILFWLKSKGLNTKKSLLILSSIGIMNPLSQIIITWPSFFIISASYGTFQNDNIWVANYWLAFAGLTFDVIAFSFYFILTYSRRVHFVLNMIYYWVRKKIKLSYKSKEEIKNKYIENATFKKEFNEEMKNYKFYGIVLFGCVLWNFLFYSSMFFSYKLSNVNLNIPFLDWYNYINISVTANNWVPIPGTEGTLQFMMLSFMNNINDSLTHSDKITINNIIFVWRLINFYIPAVIGMICMPIYMFLFFKKIKKNNVI